MTQLPHSCRKELGSVEVDDGEGGGSPKLAQEGEEYLRFEVFFHSTPLNNGFEN